MICNGEAASGNRTFVIRRMSLADVTGILAILQESPEAAMWSPESLMEGASAGAAWVAESNGQEIGFLIGRDVADDFEILNLAVAPASRRYGIARQLMSEALQHAHKTGAQRAYLEVRGSNEGALALYRRFGFRECGRRPRYYQYPVEDAVVLVLELK